MRISLEWTLEFAAAVIVCAVIFTGVHLRGIAAYMDLPAARGESAEYEAHKELREGAEGEGVQTAEEHQIEDFKIVYQMPELPTGCEITAMTMVLNYYGFDVDKVTMAEEFLPIAPAEFYYDREGELCGADLERFFVGDPATDKGYICGTKAIRAAANKYLQQNSSFLRAMDKTGISAEEIYRRVNQDIPVVVWVTINMEERREVEGWKTEEGDYVDWGRNDHGAVLIGYTENTVTIADPISGRVVYSREQFEKIYASRGKQCVFLLNYKK